MDTLPINRVILYVRHVQRMATFYEHFFGLQALPGATGRWCELINPNGGISLTFQLIAAAQKPGSAMRLVFSVADLAAFKDSAKKEGLHFGDILESHGFQYANAKDPAGNLIQICNRGML